MWGMEGSSQSGIGLVSWGDGALTQSTLTTQSFSER